MHKIGKKKIIIGAVIVLIGGFLLGKFFLARDFSLKEKFVTINGGKIRTELAVTPQSRERGLSGRAALCADCGMLFIFEKKDIYPFWMKDMQFDLDLLWIDGSKIVQIDRNVPLAGGAKVIRSPKVPVEKVLELNAGASDRWGFKIGDEIILQ